MQQVYFDPERCVGVGVNGPFLDIPLCDEIAAATKKKFRCDARNIPKTAYLESCRGAWCLAALCWAFGWVKNQECTMASLPDMKLAVKRRKRGEKGGEVFTLYMEGNSFGDTAKDQLKAACSTRGIVHDLGEDEDEDEDF